MSVFPRKRKADCTPEEWESYLKYMREWRKRPGVWDRQKSLQRAQNAKPEMKEKRRIRDANPIHKAKRLAYSASERGKAVVKAAREKKKAEDPEWWEERMARQREKRTGFKRDIYFALKTSQGNACAICRRSFDEVAPVGDHCHDSLQPRGILCTTCNFVEGHIKALPLSPIEFAQRLTHYLETPPATLLIKSHGIPHWTGNPS